MAGNKRYLYKVYRDGVPMGNLPTPDNDFAMSQEINTAGSQIQVTIPASFDDVGASLETANLTTELASDIVTPDGEHILLTKEYVFDTIAIDLANQIDVWLYYDGAPNGVRVFTGLISSYETDYIENTITLTVLSYGVRLDQHLIEAQANSIIKSYEVTDSEFELVSGTKLTTPGVAQTFQIDADSDVSTIYVQLRPTSLTPISCSLSIVEGTPTARGATLASTTRNIAGLATDWFGFTFSVPEDLLGTTTYFLELDRLDAYISTQLFVLRDSGGAYAAGSMFTSVDIPTWSTTVHDMNFRIVTASGGGSIGGTYSSTDPSDILRSLIDGFQRIGGLITYDDDSIEDTDTSVSYTFKFDTILDGVNKVLELSPANWFWFVDVGQNMIYLNQRASDPDHTMVLGLHIQNLKLKQTLEGIKNLVFFSGGDDGSGENILVSTSNTVSIAKYGTWLERKSDNRVTVVDTADTLARNILSQESQPSFQTTLEIMSEQYDIETFQLGDAIGFANFNNLIDSLILHVVAIDRTPDLAILRLDSLTPTTSHRVEDIKRNLDQVTSLDNPNQAN